MFDNPKPNGMPIIDVTTPNAILEFDNEKTHVIKIWIVIMQIQNVAMTFVLMKPQLTRASITMEIRIVQMQFVTENDVPYVADPVLSP